MSYVVLARKYRPKSFDQMVGQEHVVRALSNALEQQRLHHAYLFTGTRGIGKTTVSRILAKSLNCTGPDGNGSITAHPCGVCTACTEIDADRYIDYIELDAASNRSIDEIRDLIERAAYKPGVGRFKVFMIDEAHQLTKDAFNALLKTLEEPPDYLKFVLATTDPEKMLPTVLSRCLQFNLRPMAPETVHGHLQQVLGAEAVAFDEGALRLLSRAARGSMRDALSLTDQAIAYGGGRIDEAIVRAMLGAVDRSHARTLVEALAARDGAAVLAAVDGLRGLGLSASATLEEMATLLQQMAVQQAMPGALDPADPDSAEACRLASLLAADETQLLYSIVLHGRAELALMSDEYAALTMVLLRLLAFAPAGGGPAARPVPVRGPAAAPAPALPSAAPAARQASEARAVPLRAPPPPAITLPVLTPVPAPVPKAAAEPAANAEPLAPKPPQAPAAREPAAPGPALLGDRWYGLVNRLAAQGAIVALARELAWQAGLLAIDDTTTPPVWRLQVERESLRTPVLRDKLAAALAAELGAPLDLQLEAGVPDDSPTRRDAAERQRKQALAEETIRTDPVVLALMAQYKTARIVPGSIKPV
jgi:DNA polymerase-3 subunit gamma/tau